MKIGEEWDGTSAQKLLEWFYHEQPDLFFVAEMDGKIVGGIVALIKPWWDGNHLADGELFVHPDNQGNKIGVKLIKQLFISAKQKYQAVSWDTFTHIVHEHPLSWYKNLGFEEIEHWKMITGNIDSVLEKIKD